MVFLFHFLEQRLSYSVNWIKRLALYLIFLSTVPVVVSISRHEIAKFAASILFRNFRQPRARNKSVLYVYCIQTSQPGYQSRSANPLGFFSGLLFLRRGPLITILRTRRRWWRSQRRWAWGKGRMLRAKGLIITRRQKSRTRDVNVIKTREKDERKTPFGKRSL